MMSNDKKTEIFKITLLVYVVVFYLHDILTKVQFKTCKFLVMLWRCQLKMLSLWQSCSQLIVIYYGESVANSPLAVKHFARTLPLVAKSGEVVNHFAASFFFAATLQ